MRIPILLVLFSTLALGAKVKRATQCEMELGAALQSISESAGRCEASECGYQCVILDQGLADSTGTLTVASMQAGLVGRCSGELCTRVYTLTTECLSYFGGYLGPDSGCKNWAHGVGCIAAGLDNICDGLARVDDVVSFVRQMVSG
jgi:hypothetical protein